MKNTEPETQYRFVVNPNALEDLREGRPDPELAKYDGIEGYAVGKGIKKPLTR
jgi:hypothetical protein